MIRIQSTLDDKTEQQVATVIDCALSAHRVLGPGFIESVYHNALCLEFTNAQGQTGTYVVPHVEDIAHFR